MTGVSISIVTPCMNRVHLVAQAVESVLGQDVPALEHIIVDGGSTDGTLDVLGKYAHLRVISEPDDGMYDAINKGILLAQGEVIGLLNTDDVYPPGTLRAVADAFIHHPGAQAVVGGVTRFVEHDSGWQVVGSFPAIQPEEFWYRLIQGHPSTNAWFFRREVFERLGGFDVRMRWSADRYFLIRIALDGGIRPIPIPQVLCQYRQHSGSVTMTTLDSRDPHYGELRIKILQEDIFALGEFLQRKDLPGEVRSRMRREHSVRCYRLAATAIYHRKGKIAFQAARLGWQKDPFWPIVLLTRAIRRFIRGPAFQHG
jgi:glycosyltransferase involved in cell wall biosynthesis